MPGKAFVVSYRSAVLGSGPGKVFAFRRSIDATLVKNHMYPDLKITNVNKKVHLIEKKERQPIPPARVEPVDFESFYHRARINSLELDLVEFVIEEQAKLLVISSVMPQTEALDLDDVKKNLDHLFKKK
jgi:hypothetical protein